MKARPRPRPRPRPTPRTRAAAPPRGMIDSPGTIRTQISRVDGYVDQITTDIAATPAPITPAMAEFVTQYRNWVAKWKLFRDQNSNDPWNPLQVLSTGAIGDQCDSFEREAIAHQKRFVALGGVSTVTPPSFPPGGGGGFLSGIGTGVLLLGALLVFAELRGSHR